jgi:hypothetical protein
MGMQKDGYINRQMQYSKLDNVARNNLRHRQLRHPTKFYTVSRKDFEIARGIHKELRRQKVTKKKQKRNWLMRLYAMVKIFIIKE